MSEIYLLVDYGYNGYQILSCNKSDIEKVTCFYDELDKLNFTWFYAGEILYVIHSLENYSNENISSFYDIFDKYKNKVKERNFDLHQTHIHKKTKQEIEALNKLAELKLKGKTETLKDVIEDGE